MIDDIFLDDAHMARLRSLGDLQVYRGKAESEEEAARRISGCDIITDGWTEITDDVLSKTTGLKLISLWSTGYDYVDADAAGRRGILVSNAPDYSSRAVAEHAVALLFSIAKNIVSSDASVKSGVWDWREFPGVELKGKVIGIIGLGNIGRTMADLTRGLGMKVIGYTRHPKRYQNPGRDMQIVDDLGVLLRNSDVISIHLPSNSKTERLLGQNEFRLMKRGVLLVNTSRGRVIDESALISALQDGTVRAAGLDTITQEPPDDENPLLRMPNVILTPHSAFHTPEALRACTDVCISNIEAYLNGTPMNLVGGE